MTPRGDRTGQEIDLWAKPDEFGQVARMMRFAVLPAAVGMAVVLTGWAVSHRSGGHEVAFLLGNRDTSDQGSEWSGFFKFLGSEALLAAVGVLLFAVGLAHAWRRRRRSGTPPASTRNDVVMAVLVLVVVLDDLFMLHHAVLPGLGVPAIVGTLCYLVVLGSLAACAQRPMQRAGLRLAFTVPISCLAVAAVVVAIASHLEGLRNPTGALANTGDFVKYLGYAALCWVLVVRARSIVDQVVRRPAAPTPPGDPSAASSGLELANLHTEPFELPTGDLWPVHGELRQLGRTITRTVVPAGIGIALVLVGFAASHHAIEIALQDQDTAPGASQWSGLFTFLGCGALVVSVGVLLGALDMARAWYSRPGPGQDRRAVHAGVGVAILMLLIVFDDIFMIHDAILPSFHIPEIVGNGFYVVVGGAVVLWVMAPVHRLGLLLPMFTGLVGLAISVGGDKLEEVFEVSDPTLSHLLGNAEDISKYLGYAALCYVLVVFARTIVNQIVRELPTSPESDAPTESMALHPTPATVE
jgi:hypothetical protein